MEWYIELLTDIGWLRGTFETEAAGEVVGVPGKLSPLLGMNIKEVIKFAVDHGGYVGRRGPVPKVRRPGSGVLDRPPVIVDRRR